MGAVEDAIAGIRAGQPVILPTDTVYGLCASAEREGPSAELARLKGRDAAQPIALLAADVNALFELLPELDDRARATARALLPGPYTLVLANPARRYRWLGGSRPGTIGVRVPVLPAGSARVVGAVGAVAATSANATGGPDPVRLTDIPEELRASCAAVIDAGALSGVASTVIDFSGDEPRILREGAASGAQAIKRALGVLA